MIGFGSFIFFIFFIFFFWIEYKKYFSIERIYLFLSQLLKNSHLDNKKDYETSMAQ
jgi:hypothetical protein